MKGKFKVQLAAGGQRQESGGRALQPLPAEQNTRWAAMGRGGDGKGDGGGSDRQGRK